MSNDAFREYVTGAAFVMTLSRAQISELMAVAIVDSCAGGNLMTLFKEDNKAHRTYTQFKVRNFIAALNGLERRGLVEVVIVKEARTLDNGRKVDECLRHVTEAGWLMLKLCHLAGLCPNVDVLLTELKRKQRKVKVTP